MPHRGLRAIAGESFDDAIPGAAVGAVGKRVEIAAIFPVEYFTDAIVARRGGQAIQIHVF